jgi:hypothetical protein
LKYGFIGVCSAIRSSPANAIASRATATGAENISSASRNSPIAASANIVPIRIGITCQVASAETEETAANA